MPDDPISKRPNSLEENLRRVQECRKLSDQGIGPGGGTTPVDEEALSTRRMIALAWHAGTEMIVALFVGGGLGYVVDQSLGSSPVAIIFGAMLGLAAGGLNVWRAMKTLDQSHKDKRRA